MNCNTKNCPLYYKKSKNRCVNEYDPETCESVEIYRKVKEREEGVESAVQPIVMQGASSADVCDHSYVYKILHTHKTQNICEKCGHVEKQTV